MSIYQSTIAVPYVYLCTHKITNEFYFGYREFNVQINLPSSQDLPKYRTSSKKVKPIFDEFDWVIIAEFFGDDAGNNAYDFEQLLIHQNWGNPLLLNKNCQYTNIRFKTNLGRKLSEVTKKKMSDSKKGKNVGEKNWMYGKTGADSPNFGRQLTAEHKQKISVAHIGKSGLVGELNPMYGKTGKNCPNYGRKMSDAHKAKLKSINTGRPGMLGESNPMFGFRWSDEHKQMLRDKSIAYAASQGDAHIGSKNLRESVKKMILDGTHPTTRETVCEHCSRSIKGMSNYSRWHGNNCRNKT